MHHFLHCLVRCPPYVRIPKVARQQLGEAMEVLAAQVAWKLAGKRLYLLELCFAKCKRHSFPRGPWAVITEIDQCVGGKKFLSVCGAQDEML